jgi:hypothetical protein
MIATAPPSPVLRITSPDREIVAGTPYRFSMLSKGGRDVYSFNY